MKGLINLILCSVFLCVGNVTVAQTDLSKQANAFLSLLDPKQRDLASFEYQNDERMNWNFVPTSRRGIPFEQMNTEQKAAAISLLKATLGDQGFRKATGVLSLEAI